MEKRDFAFDKVNYILLAVGMAVVVLGFLLMSGSGSTDTAYDPDSKNGADDYEGFILKRTFSTSYASQSVTLPRNNKGRYLALVFLNSFNRTTYFIDLWELVPFGYIEGDSDIPYPDF